MMLSGFTAQCSCLAQLLPGQGLDGTQSTEPFGAIRSHSESWQPGTESTQSKSVKPLAAGMWSWPLIILNPHNHSPSHLCNTACEIEKQWWWSVTQWIWTANYFNTMTQRMINNRQAALNRNVLQMCVHLSTSITFYICRNTHQCSSFNVTKSIHSLNNFSLGLLLYCIYDRAWDLTDPCFNKLTRLYLKEHFQSNPNANDINPVLQLSLW